MSMLDILVKSGGIEAIAGQLGIPKETARAGAEALLPAVVGGFKKQGQAQQGGLGDLIGMIGGMGGGGLLDNVLAPEPTQVEKGNDILGQIFGSKEVSRQVAGHAEAQSGVSADLLKQMLPIIAMLVAGYMAKQGGGEAAGGQGGGLGGALGGILGSVMGGGQSAGGQQAGGALGGLGSLLDMDGDGNPLDDIIGMAGKFAGR